MARIGKISTSMHVSIDDKTTCWYILFVRMSRRHIILDKLLGGTVMKLLEQGKALIHNKEVRSGTTNFLLDCISALNGDYVAAARVMFSLMESPFLIQERRFWSKFEAFLNDDDISEEERFKFCARLTKNGEKGENPYRLVEAINRCDTKNKITYLVSASRCLAAEIIDLSTYFRIVHTVMNCLQEDLEFVIENITRHGEYEYSDIVQGLMNCGLMYQSVIDANGCDKYTFTPFADKLDMYSLSYTNVERYPRVISNVPSGETIKRPTEINVIAKFG